MGEHDGGRHEFRGFVAGVAEHDALVAGALFGGFFAFGFFGIDALGDVRGLGGEVFVDEDAVGVEDVVVVGVADFADGGADDFGDIDDLVEAFGADVGDGDFATDDDDV